MKLGRMLEFINALATEGVEKKKGSICVLPYPHGLLRYESRSTIFIELSYNDVK